MKVKILRYILSFISLFVIFYGQSQVLRKSNNTAERLYNGIQLPEIWPPQNIIQNSLDPIPVPYLIDPQESIDISIGRQLFVDDFLIEETNLIRKYHKAKKYEGNPVLAPTTVFEKKGSKGGNKDVVYLGHGGVFYEPRDSLFKMYYTAGWRGGLALATSKDLIKWDRPPVDSLNNSNIILTAGAKNAGEDNAVWLDLNSDKQRIKYLTDRRTNDSIQGRHSLLVSDGKNWSQSINVNSNYGDYSSFFYNPFREKWVFSIKKSDQGPRSRMYVESDEYLDGWDWKNKSVFWTRTDSLDLPDPKVGDQPQLYSLNAVAYESIMLGQFYIHLGPKNEISNERKEPKITEINLGYSRDGFHWSRPSREAFIEAARTDDSWDKGYIHGTTGVCLVVRDSLYFPYTGYSGIASDGTRGMYTGASIGIATLRRDGFVSLETSSSGYIVTKPMIFNGKYLFVNVDCPKGALRVEVLDRYNNVVPGYELDNCIPIRENKTLYRVEWKNKKDLQALDKDKIKLRFSIENGALYSFWITPDIYGASFGYQGAGAVGLSGVVDNTGVLSY